MNISWGVILAVVWVLAQVVIPWIIQQQAKRREQEQARAAAERNQQAQNPFHTATVADAGSESTRFGQQPVAVETRRIGRPIQTGKPLDDLAARRKAQLEQLRNRRMGQPQPQSQPQIQIPTQTRIGQTPPTSPGMRGRGVGVAAGPMTDEARSRQLEAERRARNESRLMREREAQLAKQREAEAKARRDRARKATEQAARQQQAERPSDEGVARGDLTRRRMPLVPLGESIEPSQKVRLSDLRKQLRDRSALRRMVIYKEILDPPVALRDLPV